jgi:ribonuclease T1
MATAGRRRYRGFVLLVAAVLLVIWFFTPAGQDDPTSGGSGPTRSPSPTHQLTQTNTPTTDATTFPSTPPASDGTDPETGLPLVRVDDLPAQVAETLRLIDEGGPFPEPAHDGGTFQNREGLLPDQPGGYYREYTVPTPGSDDRGARRVIAGDDGERFYTADHYESFARIAGYP